MLEKLSMPIFKKLPMQFAQEEEQKRKKHKLDAQEGQIQ